MLAHFVEDLGWCVTPLHPPWLRACTSALECSSQNLPNVLISIHDQTCHSHIADSALFTYAHETDKCHLG